MNEKSAFKIFWGEILRKLRKNAHLTQQDVSEMIHLSRQAYSNIECGKSHPSPETLALLSDLYNVDLYEYVLRTMPADYVAEHNTYKVKIQSMEKEIKSKEQTKKRKKKGQSKINPEDE